MKKILLCLLSLMALSNCVVLADFRERNLDYYMNMSDDELKFLVNFRTCTPARNAESNEVIRGKTKNGSCFYQYSDILHGQPVVYNCIIPMRAVVGYTTTAYDVYEYRESDPEVSQLRLQQNNEIRKIMQDYCKIK